MRKTVCTIVLALGVLIGTATAAVAQTYPPVSNPLTISSSVAVAGQPLTVSGEGAQPGATVTFTFASQPVVVATTTADGNGRFSATFRIPADATPGEHTVTATSNGEVLGVVTVRVLPASQEQLQREREAQAQAQAQDLLAFTGFNGLLKLCLGLGMIAVGVVLLLAIRRRRAGTSA
jgi:hypothetical protein